MRSADEVSRAFRVAHAELARALDDVVAGGANTSSLLSRVVDGRHLGRQRARAAAKAAAFAAAAPAAREPPADPPAAARKRAASSLAGDGADPPPEGGSRLDAVLNKQPRLEPGGAARAPRRVAEWVV